MVNETDAFGEERPPAPQWNSQPGPGKFGRGLMRLAGVDLNLALEMPLDEQRTMQRVASAALVGSAFQLFCMLTALGAVAGFTAATVLLAVVITGVLFLFDLAFISADWAAQGLALCRAYGVIPEGGRLEKLKRPLALGARWLLSFLAATLIAQFVLMGIFGADIDSYWRADRRSRNAPIVQSVTERYATLLADLNQRVTQSGERLADLKRERSLLLDPLPTAQIDQQINEQLTLQKRLNQERLQADLGANQEATDAAAEQYGVRARPTNTGLSGRGNYFAFHQTQASQQREIVRARTQDVEAVDRKLEALRQERAREVKEAGARSRSRLETVEHRLSIEQTAALDLAAERRVLEDGREAWIDTHVEQSSGYLAPPEGLLARLDGLLAITNASAALAGFVFFLKTMIMAIELAGPITKALLTPPMIYCMSVALRVTDAAAFEGERRQTWGQWRLLAANRRDEAAEVIRIARHRREAVSRASREVRDLFDNLSAKTQ